MDISKSTQNDFFDNTSVLFITKNKDRKIFDDLALYRLGIPEKYECIIIL